jgi:XTP/dITP diphosphohydrolase
MLVLIASSNPGKLRDFASAASLHGVEVALIPDFSTFPEVIEDGETFEANARKKAEHYSRMLPGQLVIADDSGLEVDALSGAPGVRSARYAAAGSEDEGNTPDEHNNAKLIDAMRDVADEERTARFVCVIAAARDGETLGTFRGSAEGVLLRDFRGSNGFGYDPLFYFPKLKNSFAELTGEEKAAVSHRGQAFRKFLEWCEKD